MALFESVLWLPASPKELFRSSEIEIERFALFLLSEVFLMRSRSTASSSSPSAFFFFSFLFLLVFPLPSIGKSRVFPSSPFALDHTQFFFCSSAEAPNFPSLLWPFLSGALLPGPGQCLLSCGVKFIAAFPSMERSCQFPPGRPPPFTICKTILPPSEQRRHRTLTEPSLT